MLCYLMLRCVVLLMVKLSLKYLRGNKGMLPIPAPVKVIVDVSGKKEKETGNHSFHLFKHTFYMKKGTQGIEKKRGEQQMKPV